MYTIFRRLNYLNEKGFGFGQIDFKADRIFFKDLKVAIENPNFPVVKDLKSKSSISKSEEDRRDKIKQIQNTVKHYRGEFLGIQPK